MILYPYYEYCARILAITAAPTVHGPSAPCILSLPHVVVGLSYCSKHGTEIHEGTVIAII